MTTIAYRDGVMAADSLSSTSDGTKFYHTQKLYRRTVGKGKQRRKVVMGLCGNVAACLAFIDWFGSDEQPPSVQSDEDFTVILADNGRLYEANRFFRLEKIREPFYAIGSGAEAALAAMHMGADAKQAVKVACKVNLGTGGKVRSVRV